MQCTNEGDFATGNHCVKLGGAALDAFQVGLAPAVQSVTT
jgi:hypothetical protein